MIRRERTPTSDSPEGKPSITPYMIINKMMDLDWREDPRKGKSNIEVDRIWDYVGYPNYTDDISWCAATVNCCLKLCGYKTSDSIPVARSFETYGKSGEGLPVRAGDIVVFKRKDSGWKGHVGFLQKIDTSDKRMTLLGGNQSNKICLKTYPFKGALLELSTIRKITINEKIGEPDYETLKKWGLI